MSEVDVNGGRKRQLPSWMTSVTTSDQLPKPKSKDDNVSSSEFQPKLRVLKSKRIPLAKRIEKDVESCENDSINVDSSLLVKCETRKGKRKSKRKDLDDDASECETKKQKKKPRQQDLDSDDFDSEDGEGEGRPQKKRTKKKVDRSGSRIERLTVPRNHRRKINEVGGREDINASSPSEDEEELTMEDLMSIAEEYVKADKEKTYQQPLTTEPEVTQLPTSPDFSRNESGSIEAAKGIRVSPTRKSMRPSSSLTNTKLNNRDNSPTEVTISSSIQLGDPTQDMLNLFLGPLLKKPETTNKKLESVMDDMTLEYELRKHKRSESLVDEVVPLAKKKSSLKDKVAIFFE